MVDIYFWRQGLVLASSLCYSMSIGFMLGFPSVLNPAITSPNSTDIRTTGDHASWIAASNGIGGVLGAFIQSPLIQFLGRRASNFSSNLFLLTGWIIFPLAGNVAALYAARVIQGIASGTVYINSIIISEYVHPSRRGYFITLKKVLIAVGTLICHALSAYWTWRQIAIFASIFPLAAILLTFFWPESPSYLALKGRFTECEKSFKWLNGNSEESQKHLKVLLEAQKEKIKTKRTINKRFIDMWRTFLKKDFQKSFFITSLLTLAIDLCGRYFFGAYVIQIMMELIDNKASVIYFSAAADLFTVIALFLSTVVIKFVKRRTILLYSGVFAVILMLSISALAYLKTVYTFSTYFHWFIALMIILQCFVVNIGLIPVSFAIFGEIFPLEDKGVGSCASTIVFTSFYAITLKTTPVLMEYTGLYGTYAIYGVALSICLVYLYKNLPETKDKTLQDIEKELNCGKNVEIIPMETEKLMH